MPGVRLHHPDLRNCTYTIIHFGVRLTQPMFCWVCQRMHIHKTYHLGLDQVGDVTVSETIYAYLQEAGLEELQATKEDRDPPPVFVDTGHQRKVIVVSREGKKEAASG